MNIVWAPDRIGEGRRFRVVVEANATVRCFYSKHLALLDRTTAPRDSKFFFYFRAITPTESAEIHFESMSVSAAVRLVVIGEREWGKDAKLHDIPLPRIWPMERRPISLKERHTLTNPDDIGKASFHAAVARAESHVLDPSGTNGETGTIPSCDALEWSDEEIWTLEPPCDIPRWHFLNLDRGCPVHGLKIYAESAYYPWIIDERNRPYHVQCPVGGEWYPSNNFAAGDHTGGEFPDDGWGWHGPDGAVFGFMSYSLLRRIRYVYSTVTSLTRYFEATGDAAAVRKIVYLLVTIAREHRYLSFFPEHRFRKYEEVVEEPQYRERRDRISWGPRETKTVANLAVGSGMDDYCINMPYHYEHLCRAYDRVFDRIDDDSGLVAFVSARMPELATGEDIRRYIETNLFRNGVQAALDDAIMSNLPRPQMALLDLIRVLDRPECKELTEWLIRGGGQVARMPVNFYYKDGASYESLGGYNGIHVSALAPIVDGLRALRREHPDIYGSAEFDPIEGHERYWHVLRFAFECVVAQIGFPLIGDTGGIPTTEESPTTVCMDVGEPLVVYDGAVKSFPDDETFQVMRELLRKQSGGEKITPDARLMQPSRLLDGYGIGILESGSLEDRRGIWLYYGDHPGHSHEQPMDIGLFAHKRNLLRHMGYPYSWQHMDTWDGNWLTHFGVKVVASQCPVWRSTVRLFHGKGAFQVVEAGGYGFANRPEGGIEAMPGFEQRRMLCMVDLPDGRYYAIDLFHLEGGDDHWWTFHGLPGELTMSADLPTQNGGTVAGENIAYGTKSPDGTPDSLAYLYDVRRAPCDGPWSAHWLLKDTDNLQLRITQISPSCGELVAARGRSPHAPAENPPYELDWLLRHSTRQEDAPLVSDFVSVIESGHSLPLEAAETIEVGAASGVKMTFESCVQYILRSDDPTQTAIIDTELAFRGACGFLEMGSNGPTKITLIGDGALTWQGVGITQGATNWEGLIAGVDVASKTLTVLGASADAVPAVGEYLLVCRENGDEADNYAYRVEASQTTSDGMIAIRLNWSPLIADGTVKEIMEAGFRAQGQIPISSGRAYYRGAHILNHDGSVHARIESIRGGWSAQEPVVKLTGFEGSLADAFPPGTPFYVQEIAEGDSVVVLGWTVAERVADGTWQIESNGLPETSIGD
jgi:hypothetical protein